MSVSTPSEQAVYLVTGTEAAGTSTVAQVLTDRLHHSVHVRGDLFRRMMVTDRPDPAADPGKETLRRLRLHHDLTATVVDGYYGAGFSVVAQDVLLGRELGDLVASIRSRPLHVVVLAPRPAAAGEHGAGENLRSFHLLDVGQYGRAPRGEMPGLGLWIDSSDQTPVQTVEEILRRTPAAAVPR